MTISYSRNASYFFYNQIIFYIYNMCFDFCICDSNTSILRGKIFLSWKSILFGLYFSNQHRIYLKNLDLCNTVFNIRFIIIKFSQNRKHKLPFFKNFWVIFTVNLCFEKSFNLPISRMVILLFFHHAIFLKLYQVIQLDYNCNFCKTFRVTWVYL